MHDPLAVGIAVGAVLVTALALWVLAIATFHRPPHVDVAGPARHRAQSAMRSAKMALGVLGSTNPTPEDHRATEGAHRG